MIFPHLESLGMILILSTLLLLFLKSETIYYLDAVMLWIHELFPLSGDREFPRDSPYPIAILNTCSQKLRTHILMLEDGFCCQYTSSHSNAFSGLLSDAAFAQESSPLCFHKVAT